MFDPYAEWLGIPKDQRPVSCYQMLDIAEDETDSKAIEKAAAQRAAVVQAHTAGPQAAVAARVLKEIAQARATLLDPARRKQYDAVLRKRAASKSAPAPAPSEPAEPAAEAEEEDRTPEDEAKPRKKKGAASRKKRPAPEAGSRRGLWLGVGAAAVLLVGGGLAAFVWMGSDKPSPAPAPVDPVAAVAPRPEPTAPRKPAPEPAPQPPAPAPAEAPKPAPAPVQPAVATAPPPAPKPVPKPAPRIVRQAVPAQAALVVATKEHREKYKADYASDKPEDQLVLAARLLQPGREDRTNPAAWFVLLREARDLAVQAGRPRLAVEACDELAQQFEVDGLAMKLETLTQMGKSDNALVLRAVAQTALALVRQVVAEDNYEAALRLIDFAESILRKTKPDEKDLALIETRRNEVTGYRKSYPEVVAAREKLQKSPEDPQANLVVGRHLGFFHGRWDEGLPYLARGSDAPLKNLAQRDLAQPADPKAQLAVADEWWGLGFGGGTRRNLHAHERALYWYEAAEPALTGDDKKRASERITKAHERLAARPHRLLPGSFFGRDPESKVLLLREGGGSMQSEEAVQRGLDWLARHQAPNGMWSTDRFHEHGKCNCNDPGQTFDIAGTAFGLLPFLGAGELARGSRYNKTVTRGLEFLISKQQKEGNFSGNMYENALATIAVCEAYALTQDARLKVPAQAAMNYILRAQNKEGGWGYSPGAKGDTSVTGWQFSALKAGYYAKLAVPPAVFANVDRFLKTVADPNGNGFGYNTPGTGRATTAVGLMCLAYLGRGVRDPALSKGITYLSQPQQFVTPESPSIYFLFYATQAMHHYGGQPWKDWNAKVRDLLIDLQDKGKDVVFSHREGSWSPYGDEYAAQGGRLMFTSLALLTLESYYWSVPLNGYGMAVLLD